jgi:peptidoglycan/xylan/chitin deacetylase (PgdA/CDA1 family)
VTAPSAALPVAVKLVAERGIIALADVVGHRWLRGRHLILSYHNVIPDRSPAVGDLPNHVPLSDFRHQLDELQKRYDVVGLGELATRAEARSPAAAITFDDAYSGALTLGWGELRKRGLPATCFVVPGSPQDGSFWWDVLAAEGGRLDPSLRAFVLEKLNGSDSRAREWAAMKGHRLQSLPQEWRIASEHTIERAASEGMRLGSHTWSHPALPTLTPVELRDELTRSLAWLRARHGEAVLPWLCYPYGLSSPEVEVAAAEAGYEGAVLASGGSYRGTAKGRFDVPRLTVPAGVSRRGFAIRLYGVIE